MSGAAPDEAQMSATQASGGARDVGGGAAELSVAIVLEPSEHSSDGVGLSGDLDPLHRPAAANAGAGVALPHMSEQPRPRPSLAGALLLLAAVVRPEGKLPIVVVEQWIADSRRRPR